MTNLDPLKLMIVDDTITYRTVLKQVVRDIPDVTVVTTASNGKFALEQLAQNEIDLVLLDVEMPEMDGLEALRFIRKDYPHVSVVMVSGANQTSADITIKALEAGALDFVSKPTDTSSSEESIVFLREKLAPIISHIQHSRVPRQETSSPSVTPTQQQVQPPTQSTFTQPSTISGSIDLIAIGISTGGPKALNELIPNLPADIGIPILLVIHMPPFFTKSLAQGLNDKSKLAVKEAEQGETVLPNTVYIAPGGFHMAVAPHEGSQIKITLNEDPPENSCRPAADVLFRSILNTPKQHALTLVMTGMGSDGALGVKTLKESNRCYSLTQSSDTCTIYGMPKAVDDMNLSDEQVPLEMLAGRVVDLVQKYTRIGAGR
ncbi:MAG: chemotaxis-specific protein-glutamate methyltransferase CheB [Vampirovibrio sp.]|nr:chemotaxis-specific protein-glutamate methyltransferase CheB [Vampirovibrio sp.]